MNLELSADWQGAGSIDTTCDCYEELVIGIIRQACKDYSVSVYRLFRDHDDKLAQTMKADVEQFFHSEWFHTLYDLDGGILLKRLYEMELFKARKRFQTQ